MRVTLAGVGAREALRTGGRGEVVASFRLACYVTVDEELLALVAPRVHPGPVHLILDGRPPRRARGSRVEVADGLLIVGGHRIDVAGPAEWVGTLPPQAAVRAAAEAIARAAAELAGRSPLLAGPFRDPADTAVWLLQAGRLDDAVRALAGLGPGLTPSGDDAVAGIVFALRALGGQESRSTAPEIARMVTGSPISRAFVLWAARGQALAPAHHLLHAAVGGDGSSARSAARALGAVGETSGSDFLLGLTWGLSAALHLGDHPTFVRRGRSAISR